jgi:hypothetical protein
MTEIRALRSSANQNTANDVPLRIEINENWNLLWNRTVEVIRQSDCLVSEARSRQ